MKRLDFRWATHFKTLTVAYIYKIASKAFFILAFGLLTKSLVYSPIAYGQDVYIQSNDGGQIGSAAILKGVAVVDFEYALRTSDAAIDLRSQIEALRIRLETDFKADRDALRKEETDLTLFNSQANSKEANARQRLFNEHVSNLQRRIQQANSLIEDAYGRALTKIRSKLIEAVAEVARKGGYDLIIRRSQAIIFRQSIDETAAAVKTLNEQMSRVHLNIDTSVMSSILSQSKALLPPHSKPETKGLEK